MVVVKEFVWFLEALVRKRGGGVVGVEGGWRWGRWGGNNWVEYDLEVVGEWDGRCDEEV